MKLKVDENGAVVLQDGKPVYVDKDGKDVAVDVPKLFEDVTALNAEAASRRKKANELEDKLKPFEGLDADAAKKALETVKNMDAGILKNVEEVEKLKAEIAKGYTEKLDTASKTIAAKDGTIRQLLVSSAFRGSKALEATLLTPEVAEAFFGPRFEVQEESGQVSVVGKRADGTPIMSRENPTQPAAFEEALGVLIDDYPRRDEILKAGSGPGSGAGGNGGGGGDFPAKTKNFTAAQKAEFIGKQGLDAWKKRVDAENNDKE